jgi:hypothetical protein
VLNFNRKLFLSIVANLSKGGDAKSWVYSCRAQPGLPDCRGFTYQVYCVAFEPGTKSGLFFKLDAHTNLIGVGLRCWMKKM